MSIITVSIPYVAGDIKRPFFPRIGDVPRTGGPFMPPLKAPKTTFVSEDFQTVRIPFMPSQIEVDSLTPVWSTIDRPGRAPLLVYEGEQLPQVTFTIFIAAEDQKINDAMSVDPWITQFRQYIKDRKRWRFTFNEQVSNAWWRFTDVSLSTQLVSSVDNSTTVATMDVQLTQASDLSVRVGPVSGGVQPVPGTTPSTGVTPYTSYTIRSAGDTLWVLAARFLGNGNRWKEIAALNKISDPRKIKVGQVLRIPAR